MDINIVDINTFDISKITFSKSVLITPIKKKISIGYDDNIDLHILSPIFINNMNFLSNNKYPYLKLIFDPMLGHILKFYTFIQNIEIYITQHIEKNKNNKYTISSIIKNDQSDYNDLFDNTNHNDYIRTIFLKLSNLYKSEPKYKVFDNNLQECNLNSLKNGWKFKTLIKIDYVWIDIEKKKFGLSLDLIQLKIIQPISQIKCLIDNDIPDIKKENFKLRNSNNDIDQTIPKISPVSDKNPNVSDQEKTERPQIFIPPNPLELLKMRSALKKVLS
jgi:hypothetical protein